MASAALLVLIVLGFGPLSRWRTARDLARATKGRIKTDLGTWGKVDVSGLPEELRYPGAKATLHWTNAGDASAILGGYELETEDPVSKVADWYSRTPTGWKPSARTRYRIDNSFAYRSLDEQQSALITVTATENSKNTSISITLETKRG